MAKISMADADKIMAHIGYTRSMSSCDPKTGEVLECYYSNLDIEKFSVLVKVRLEDAAFAFQYHQGLQTMTVLKTDWFSPLTSKKHFMKWFKQFVSDAFWFNKRYADIMDERILEDMVTLCDGVLNEYTPEEWNDMSQKDKMVWCEQYGLEHAHVIKDERDGW